LAFSDPRLRKLFGRDQLPATPWKNGGGLTREIVRIPLESRMDDFRWRVSIAELSADGSFSTFEGVDRVIMLLSGAGVHLGSSDGAVDHRLDTPLTPFAFAGERDISASLLGNASSDFNIMTRRGSAKADVRVVRGVERLDACPAGVLYAARGTWRARIGDADYSMTENSGVWWDEEPTAWSLVPEDGDAALIVVRVAAEAGDRRPPARLREKLRN
jgi:hypothetical protein